MLMNSNYIPNKRHLNCRGFTLIEVMVAIFIMSLGMLGLAIMQMNSLRYSQSAYFRSQATVLAYDIVDRMRVNSLGVSNGYYDAINTGDSAPTDPSCITTSDGCNAQQLAQYDIRSWMQNFNNASGQDDYVPTLPSALGTVTNLSGNLYQVVINWVEMGETGQASNSLTLNVRLKDNQ